MKLSFVIPCYGSVDTIEAVLAEIAATMALKPEHDYELICVNDFSPDGVLGVLKTLAQSNERLTVVDLAKNMGKHAAVMAGYSLVTGDVVINLDDDGQCPMDRLWDLMSPLDEGFDVSMARYPVKKQSAFKNFGSAVNSRMSQFLIGKPKDLAMENFSAVKRFAIDEILRYKNPYPYLEGLILRTTNRIANVEMEQRDRFAGTGNFTFGKSFSLWLNGFTAFSIKPLRLSTLLGFIVALAGFVYGAYTIISKLFHPEIPQGYASTMAALLFIGGMIMVMLGMLGEYVGRIYISINNSPQYVIRKVYRK